jgi:pimeloyl-ACP methyl ester carboxylesterase
MLGVHLHAMEGVVLLHGLCRTSASMNRMAAALTGAGYLVDNIDYPSRRARVGMLSEQVIGAAMKNDKLAGCDKVHFVTHSLGGILVRDYFSRHHDPRLGRVVMLGPPNQGSEVVDRLKDWSVFTKVNGPAGVELGTHQDSVPHQLGPATFDLGVIAGDRSINWINSLMIPGADDGKVSVQNTRVAGMKDHLVVHTAHPFIMRNRKVIAATLRFLQTGAFNPA